MTPEIQRPSPPYAQIADHYRDLIATGALREGDRLPTVVDMAEKFSVSPGTAHKAVRQLRGEGLLRTTQQGTVVLGPRALPAPAERIRRLKPSDHDIVDVNEVGGVPMLPSIGAALGINADALNMTVIRRQAVTYREGRPYRLSVSWLPAPFSHDVPELLVAEPIPNILHLIGERTGRNATHGRDYFEGRTADAREAAALEIDEGAAVLAGTSVWSDGTGPIQYYEFVAPPRHAVTNDYLLETRAEDPA
ncbi:GntR family transcriptional regulator [Actinorugispora endophytica]|uniref:DNA-binding GntR family transcriptional regulator n=1 Tax=Actinorugispora endophytica TaxID=1605990 RepID=A0A4V3D989_9ACTN|nr:GntR family transcriptional regulator [Actinorugispora endophytica]TDQ55050.1 DNA-binding GntR family transcriptional regulator [Actinorugispora endophytica]